MGADGAAEAMRMAKNDAGFQARKREIFQDIDCKGVYTATYEKLVYLAICMGREDHLHFALNLWANNNKYA